jgi:WD40 repeat protein
LLHSLQGHRDVVNAVAYSADGKRLGSAGWEPELRIWDPATGQEVGMLRYQPKLQEKR